MVIKVKFQASLLGKSVTLQQVYRYLCVHQIYLGLHSQLDSATLNEITEGTI
jgi:hypothetical protein